MRIIKLTAIIAATLLCLTACHSKEDDNTVSVGIIDGPDAIIWSTAQQVAKERYGLTVNLVNFSDYNLPNEALNSNEIDANAFQHKPFLDTQIQANGYHLMPVANTFLYPIALYSKKIKTISAIKTGDIIAIPNDPSNEGRALLLLEQAKLIKLRANAGINATVVDIIDNPKKLDIKELDAAQLPRVLPDVTAAVINNDFAKPAGLSADKDGLIIESVKSPYMNIIVVRMGNENSPKIQKLIEAYHSPEVKAAAKKLYGNNAVAGW